VPSAVKPQLIGSILGSRTRADAVPVVEIRGRHGNKGEVGG
jgi:hypothetical protein